jgi:hypothetical protein
LEPHSLQEHLAPRAAAGETASQAAGTACASAWESRALTRERGNAVSHEFRVAFQDQAAGARYALALASLLGSIAEELVATDVNGQLRDDLDLHELQQRLQTNRIASLRLRLPLGKTLALVRVAIETQEPSISLSLPVADQNGARGLWLQADPDHLGPLPLLVLPTVDGAFTLEALHALVALGARVGGFVDAELQADGVARPDARWRSTKRDIGAQPIVGTQQDSRWGPSPEASAQNEAVAWFAAERADPTTQRLSPEWCESLREILRSQPSINVIEGHLRAAEIELPPIRVVDPEHAPDGKFMVPAEDGVVAALHPSDEAVVLTLDLTQPAEIIESAVLHSIGHLALGHVRPGDAWGHWDTLKTVVSPTPHRTWDQEAKEFAARYVAGPAVRRVEKLDECTPLEKAQLGLWRMIGEMLGESRRLHPAADRYQHAAYQRQAAQRLTSMLEDYGGAMLCDGVGLGKTYVATTMIVHYVNAWRDKWASSPDRLVQDPCRITVIAPHSVVSTWRREALPGLGAFGVPLAAVRVISHTQLSRMVRVSELLEPVNGGMSDLEHLLLSDLVIVDEAHNFRSIAARRTKVLRDLLRVQPRREARRRVVLLTATPINNSLDDLRQEVSLLFCRPLWLSDAKTDDAYRRQAVKEIADRCTKARAARSKGDVAPLVVHGQADAKFSDAVEFRDDLDFGPNVQRIGDYLKEQDRRLKELQDEIRTAAQTGAPGAARPQVRIAEDLMDRIVVQRSRALCKEIERQQSSTVELLFRADAGAPEKLRYSDEYDGIKDVLAGFLPLFDTTEGSRRKGRRPPLSLKVYMWYDVREGFKTAEDTSSVVGLQRVLVLKRLESSPVSFLITLIRLAVLHAHRLQQLENLCVTVGDKLRAKELQDTLEALLEAQPRRALAKIRSLATGDRSTDPQADFIGRLSDAYSADRPAADPDDPPPQLSLLDTSPDHPRREELERLWPLREAILEDFATLLDVTPGLADIVFGKFNDEQWPHRFIAGGEDIDWPTSPEWGRRLVTDAKLRQLVCRLLQARRAHQKVIVFSQFSDTIAYIQSVLKACADFSRTDWQLIAPGIALPRLRAEELPGLLEATSSITGATEDRDEVVNAFAPYYRIGPVRPTPGDGDGRHLDEAWEASWSGAILGPIDVLLSTDVLAEGVNLQDAAQLINYDVHWNPVRMIQRAGRIDRRLNPRIEKGGDFPDLEALAARCGRPLPLYYWHTHSEDPPVTVNMILPDELEKELLLRERIATKTLAIDFTLGLEQGTGAEADWMANYTYQGVTSLNSLQRDRAIEQIASHQERLAQTLRAIGVDFSWGEKLNAWLREVAADEGAPLLARTRVGRRGGELTAYSRYLQPVVANGVPHWLWSQVKPGPSILNFWLALDGKTFPAAARSDLQWTEPQSMPLGPHHLLAAAERLEACVLAELPPHHVGRPLMQGVTAVSAGFLGSESDRKAVAIGEFFLLQMRDFGLPTGGDTDPSSTSSNQEA